MKKTRIHFLSLLLAASLFLNGCGENSAFSKFLQDFFSSLGRAIELIFTIHPRAEEGTEFVFNDKSGNQQKLTLRFHTDHPGVLGADGLPKLFALNVDSIDKENPPKLGGTVHRNHGCADAEAVRDENGEPMKLIKDTPVVEKEVTPDGESILKWNDSENGVVLQSDVLLKDLKEYLVTQAKAGNPMSKVSVKMHLIAPDGYEVDAGLQSFLDYVKMCYDFDFSQEAVPAQ